MQIKMLDNRQFFQNGRRDIVRYANENDLDEVVCFNSCDGVSNPAFGGDINC
ncbi:hypothetical protein D3C76_1002590 [compost metagenome]